MSDSYTKVTKTSYLENIKNSFSGAIIGILLFIASFFVLWFNEAHSAKQTVIANYMQKNAIETDCTTINSEYNDKLIATHGSAVTSDILTDGIVSIKDALVLARNVEMYQWIEYESSTKKDNLGGSTTTQTTYTYSKEWSNISHDSSKFHTKGHNNPPFALKEEKYYANNATFGAYTLLKDQIGKINASDDYLTLPDSKEYSKINGIYYKGLNYENPEVGDMKISYEYAPSGTDISIIGKQNSNKTITPLLNKQDKIYLQYNGSLTKDEMIQKFKKGNVILTVILRFVGWLLMFIGLNMSINPIITVLKVISLVAGIANFISGLVLLLISLILSLLVISLAWIIYRPVFAIILLLIIFALCCLIKLNIDKKKKNL